MGVSLNGGTPNLHPKMIIFSRKTHGFVGETHHFGDSPISYGKVPSISSANSSRLLHLQQSPGSTEDHPNAQVPQADLSKAAKWISCVMFFQANDGFWLGRYEYT